MENFKNLKVDTFYQAGNCYHGSYNFHGRNGEFYYYPDNAEMPIRHALYVAIDYVNDNNLTDDLVELIKEEIETFGEDIRVVVPPTFEQVYSRLREPVEVLSEILEGRVLELDVVEDWAREILYIVEECRERFGN